MPAVKHSDFSAGQVTDKARHKLPDKAVWQARDVFLKEDDTLSRVGGVTSAQAAASVVSPADIMALDSSEADNILAAILYDESGGVGVQQKYAAFPLSAGLSTISGVTSLASPYLTGWNTPTGGGRPSRYFNRVLRPNGIPSALVPGHGYRAFSLWAGGALTAGKTVRTSASVIAVVPGDNLLTGFSAADTAAMEVGNIVNLASAAGTTIYYGRIVEIAGATTVRVSPTPTGTAAAAGYSTAAGGWSVGVVTQTQSRTGGISYIAGARSLTTWGDRVVLGGVAYDLLSSGTKLDVRANRLTWGLLPAVDSAVVAGIYYDGYRELGVETFLATDFSDVMGMETILGVEPINQGEMLVLGYPRIYRVVGYFSTLTTQAGGGNTWDVRAIQDAVACISDAATATTPNGVLFAAFDGIFLYRGGRAINAMSGRIARQWQDALRGGATVTGGGYLGRDHYAVFTTAGGFLCNLSGDSFRWKELTLSNMGQVALDPNRPGAGYLIRKNPGSGSTSNKVVRSEPILEPAAANKTDAVTGGPSPQIVTRAFTEGDPGRLRHWRKVEIALRVTTAGTVTVTALPGLDADETPVVLGTFTAATGAQIKRFDIQTAVPLISKAVSLQFTVTGNPDEFEIVSVKFESTALNERRVA